MKSLKNVLSIFAFVFAIGAAFAFDTKLDSTLANQTVYYTTPVGCVSATCSDTPDQLCIGTVTNYYDDRGCIGDLSDYKYKPE